MAKIDIITLTGFTATDGSMIASGATVKFSSEFMVGNTTIRVKPVVFRNRELFEAGYRNVETDEILQEFFLNLPEEEYYVLTPTLLYQHVCDYLNNWIGDILFEVQITA